jgi:1-acyl-sn-glycerol-3-phosphate acyltransferase
MLIVLTPWVYFRPRSRVRILGAFAQMVAHGTLGIVRHVGGAKIELHASIPARPGVLMIMNHQSIVDIPAAAACVPGAYPRMVARARYGRGIPMVSHMISLYGHILVQPGRMGRRDLDALAETGRTSTLPILIYPEGHRTHDGEIRPWKRAGLDAFLSARDWSVYVLVVDGLYGVGRVPDFVRNISSVRCRVEMVGPFAYDGRDRETHDEFVEELRRVMCAKLSDMRAQARSSTANEERPAQTTVQQRE